jgi:hypothetical protein
MDGEVVANLAQLGIARGEVLLTMSEQGRVQKSGPPVELVRAEAARRADDLGSKAGRQVVPHPVEQVLEVLKLPGAQGLPDVPAARGSMVTE